ncbi:MAG TPA: asparagine synthase (glutamine-hydrolyzing) [Sedimentisphaerales bacterium]|nr:asparagine synthase (glutamine-hydrolyzing) [Sedimentisphaerales bacterium]
MCGIAGYVGLDDPELLREMCASLTHRGPDDAGFFTSSGVGIAMRRLSVIDLKTGHQPITNEDHSIQVVSNGEIYNYQELTTQLKLQGHKFTTSSDTETIVHLYEQYELDFVKHLRGMFAIALWDTKRRRLVLARDRIGEKPLFYQNSNGEFLFGSEIKAILQRGQKRSVNAQAVCEFFALGYLSAPRTFYQGIHKLAPAHILVYENNNVDIRRYWSRSCPGSSTLPFKKAAAELSDLMDDTIKLCLKSDVEVGAFLSGGLDSSTIVSLMRRHSVDVQTFSVGYEGNASGFNELKYAKQMAKELGTKHHELIIGPYSSVDLLPKVLWHYDEPHGEPISTLVYLLSEFTKKKVKVVLGGTGGDELFFGYPRHLGIRLLQYYKLLPIFLRRQIIEKIVQKMPELNKGKPFARRAHRFVAASSLPADEAYLRWVSLFSCDIRDQLLSSTVKTNADDPIAEQFLRAYLIGGNGTVLDRAASLDIEGYLPEYQLAYMDRMTMAQGLECRSPLCDYRLVDFATSLPASYRLKGRRSKHIFKEIAQQWIPRQIVNRKKVGFESPIGQWIKDQLRSFVEVFLSRENIERSGLLNYDGVSRVLCDHFSGRRDYALHIWSILALECWYRMYIEDRITNGSDYKLKDLRGVSAEVAVFSETRENLDVRPTYFDKVENKKTYSILPIVVPSREKLWFNAPKTLRKIIQPIVKVVPQRILLGRKFQKNLAFTSNCQWWPPYTYDIYNLTQLRRICTLAYEKTEYYRRAFDNIGFHPHNLKSLSDFSEIPTIDKCTVRKHLRQMLTVPPDNPNADYCSTGGTSGMPLSFYINADRSPTEYSYLVASWERIGYKLGMPMAVLRGRMVQPDRNGLRHEYDPILRHHYYSSFHMSDENIACYLKHIASIGACFLHVYPSTIAGLARFILRNGTHAPKNIRGIIAESEIVYPEQRQMVEEVFGCRYFSCYGQSEKVVLATGCEQNNDYHVWPTYGYFELLDVNDNPVNTPGQRGEIVGTGFINTVMPFIRYRTGDWATYVGERCKACGREHAIIRDIRGHRIQEVLIAADGSEISWAALNMHDDTFVHVRQFQFMQETPGQAVLRIVPADGFGEDDADRIHRNLGRKLDNRLAFTIKLTEVIPLSARGKAIYVDQRIQHNR